jgi:hypothetical protein
VSADFRVRVMLYILFRCWLMRLQNRCEYLLYRYARGVLKILGSVDKIMIKCDFDGDDAIGIDYDMSHNSETCLATCFKRRAFKSAFFPDCDL